MYYTLVRAKPAMVTPARVELSITGLKGWCPYLLDEGAA